MSWLPAAGSAMQFACMLLAVGSRDSLSEGAWSLCAIMHHHVGLTAIAGHRGPMMLFRQSAAASCLRQHLRVLVRQAKHLRLCLSTKAYGIWLGHECTRTSRCGTPIALYCIQAF